MDITISTIFDILDKQIKQQMQYKNEYIEKNGYYHKDILNRFDTKITALTELYFVFNEELKKGAKNNGNNKL